MVALVEAEEEAEALEVKETLDKVKIDSKMIVPDKKIIYNKNL